MRWPRFRVRTMMVAVALVGLVIAGERFWRRSQFYRKQAALCAFFECQHLWYANPENVLIIPGDDYDDRQAQIDEASKYRVLKEQYRRISRRPWEALPPGTPVAVNPWDLSRLSASEIEEMVAHVDDP
ncbi:MAG: hypothetical protein P4L84_07125 [Isosphaeraceae bacterium]|nr:hypothetical protein [Isosphaeraceae bacterium]